MLAHKESRVGIIEWIRSRRHTIVVGYGHRGDEVGRLIGADIVKGRTRWSKLKESFCRRYRVIPAGRQVAMGVVTGAAGRNA